MVPGGSFSVSFILTLHGLHSHSQKPETNTIQSDAAQHRHYLCPLFPCYEIYKTNPRKNPWESVGYNLYRSPKPGLPKNEWIKINEAPIRPTESGKVKYRIRNAVPDGSEYYVATVNAIGLESDAAGPAVIIDAPRVIVKSAFFSARRPMKAEGSKR